MGDVVPFRPGRPLPEDDLERRRAMNRHPAGKRSPAWATTPTSSGIHCTVCGLVFARGSVPEVGPLICRECRAERQAREDQAARDAQHPSLFDQPGGDA